MPPSGRPALIASQIQPSLPPQPTPVVSGAQYDRWALLYHGDASRQPRHRPVHLRTVRSVVDEDRGGAPLRVPCHLRRQGLADAHRLTGTCLGLLAAWIWSPWANCDAVRSSPNLPGSARGTCRESKMANSPQPPLVDRGPRSRAASLAHRTDQLAYPCAGQRRHRCLHLTRYASIAPHRRLPGGDTVDIDVLRSRVGNVLDAQQACRHDAVAAALPRLIRDVHTTPLTATAELAQRTRATTPIGSGLDPPTSESGG